MTNMIDLMKRGFRALMSSIWALWLAPAVWPALALYGLLGFIVGHIDGASPVRELRADVATAIAARNAAESSLNREREKVRTLTKALEDKSAPPAPAHVAAAAPPAAAAAPAVVARKLRPKVQPVAAAKPFSLWPF